MKDFHQPVLLEEVVHYLRPRAGGTFADCTLGGSGHAEAILERTAPSGLVLGIDLDPLAIEVAKKATKKYGSRIIIVRNNFKKLKQIANDEQLNKFDGILLDLGLSSGQIQDRQRGFSFLAEGKIDMRFGPMGEITAERIINTYRENQLVEIFKEYGEERLARPIAKKIIEIRKQQPIQTPQQLLTIAAEVYQKFYRNKSKINPATKIFQALRIAVNDELTNLKEVLPQAASLLKKGGRLVVISYHSLEDRIVKDFFRNENRSCICPPQLPTCQCNHKKTLKIITKKPIEPTGKEILENPRSRSAKLRVAEKI